MYSFGTPDKVMVFDDHDSNAAKQARGDHAVSVRGSDCTGIVDDTMDAGIALPLLLYFLIMFVVSFLIARRLGADYERGTAHSHVTCHGQRGQGTNNGYFPRIAGKPAGYLYNQLLAFQNGTRKYPPMNYLIA